MIYKVKHTKKPEKPDEGERMIKMFKVDYGTGVVHEVAGDLEAAKAAAVEGMTYTQEHVKILDENGAEVVISRWYGVEPSEDDEVLAAFGSYGFYGEWQEGN